ncbi:S-layer homology domain-containing protein [Halalkalibacterium ligniniphilum]|uniref:S-layer homology domain-containing protein n=1 Tax=Halalkalibacterium ligniniphilum TaxID=1134413 RepID=UPI0003479CD1|nr:S-layer homology domain-containing protein [Halalkalibacterium ligniniphilum]
MHAYLRKGSFSWAASSTLALTLIFSPVVLAENPDIVEKKTIEEVDPPLEEEMEEVPVEEETPVPQVYYKDVSPDHVAFAAIHFLTERGILSGSADGTFQPDQPLTRAQAAKILAEELQLSAPASYRLQAADVDQGHWAHDYFRALAANGIMTGSNGKYHPNDPVTRAQMAALLNRAYDYASPARFATFEDVDRSFWAYHDINRLAANGITTQAGASFNPNRAITRGQFALFVARSIDDRFKPYEFR